MKSDATVLKHLNRALGNELVAINQYFLHSRMFQDWGLNKLADKEYEESIDEMKHADQLVQRILFLVMQKHHSGLTIFPVLSPYLKNIQLMN